MEKINRPLLSDLPSLASFENTLVQFCQECKNGTRKWESSSNLYLLLRTELKNLTKNHCSFCDGYPLKVTSKETIEHYYPKSNFPEKTYDWTNLFYCCDTCQSNANKISFEETIRPDDINYNFEKIFYFDPQSGKIKVLEHLKTANKAIFDKAELFLKRYGINDSIERNQTRKTLYTDTINLLKSNSLGDIERPYRSVVRTATDSYNLWK